MHGMMIKRCVIGALAGVHHRCVLQAELEGREAEVQGSHGSAPSQQSHGQQNLDPRHVFPQRKEVSRP